MSYIGVSNQNTDFTMDGSYQIYLVDCTNNNVTVTMGDINVISNGYIFTIKRMDSTTNTLTIVCSAGQTIDGNPTYTLPDSFSNTSKTFLSWNTEWSSIY
jgi:hypothetical protein